MILAGIGRPRRRHGLEVASDEGHRQIRCHRRGRIEGGEFAEDLIGLRLMRLARHGRWKTGPTSARKSPHGIGWGRRARRSFRVISGVMMQGPFSRYVSQAPVTVRNGTNRSQARALAAAVMTIEG